MILETLTLNVAKIMTCSVCHVLLLLLVSVVAECMYHKNCCGPGLALMLVLLLLNFAPVGAMPGPKGFVLKVDLSHGD